MADVKQRSLPDLRINEFSPDACSVEYDKGDDTLFCLKEPAQAGTSIDLAGQAWLRVQPESGEVLGFEIEDYEAFFLRRHPELAPHWARSQADTDPRAQNRLKKALWECLRASLPETPSTQHASDTSRTPGSIDRQPVESSTMRSVGYDTAARVLQIEFQNGAIYDYPNVPPEMVEASLNADSLGTYFNEHVRKGFPYRRVDPPA